jgi:hypothetical protein
VRASYSQQRLPQFKGNPLIEALPPAMTDEQLLESLTLQPDFHADQREWTTHERLQMLPTLQNFMIPLTRHTELARAMDSILRAGYVGRAPRTPEQAKILQGIYEMQKSGATFSQAAETRTPQLSTALVGLSGMGKTTTVVRWLAHMPQVIYHPQLNLYQVIYLHIEMPSDGSSIKGLAYAILHKLDELIPGGNYYETYTAKGRTGADALMRSVARLLTIHCVGLLVCDEVQNLANSNKGAQTVMTELVSACNDLKVPILFIGTNKAKKVLSLDFRQSRRSSGNGIAPWTQLIPANNKDEIDEWRDFMEVLWTYQWVKHPVPLTDHLLDTMYYYSQGIIDIAIKLFASTQAKAMADGSERLSANLIARVFNEEMQLLHPVIEALRTNDVHALESFDDVAPLKLQDIVDAAERRVRNNSSSVFRRGTDLMDKSVQTKLSSALVAAGIDEDDAVATVAAVTARTPNGTIAESLKKAVSALDKPRKASTSITPGSERTSQVFDFQGRPLDYRCAIFEARQNKSTVLKELKKLGHAKPLEELLDLA